MDAEILLGIGGSVLALLLILDDKRRERTEARHTQAVKTLRPRPTPIRPELAEVVDMRFVRHTQAVRLMAEALASGDLSDFGRLPVPQTDIREIHAATAYEPPDGVA